MGKFFLIIILGILPLSLAYGQERSVKPADSRTVPVVALGENKDQPHRRSYQDVQGRQMERSQPNAETKDDVKAIGAPDGYEKVNDGKKEPTSISVRLDQINSKQSLLSGFKTLSKNTSFFKSITIALPKRSLNQTYHSLKSKGEIWQRIDKWLDNQKNSKEATEYMAKLLALTAQLSLRQVKFKGEKVSAEEAFEILQEQLNNNMPLDVIWNQFEWDWLPEVKLELQNNAEAAQIRENEFIDNVLQRLSELSRDESRPALRRQCYRDMYNILLKHKREQTILFQRAMRVQNLNAEIQSEPSASTAQK